MPSHGIKDDLENAGALWIDEPLTIDDQTLADQTLTICDRDTMQQDRIPIKEVADVIRARSRS